MREFEALVEDDNGRRAIVTVRAVDADAAREHARYILSASEARVIEVRAAFARHVWTWLTEGPF